MRKIKIYKFQVVYLLSSTLALLVGIFGIWHNFLNVYWGSVLIIIGTGLDTTVITAIFENRNKAK